MSEELKPCAVRWRFADGTRWNMTHNPPIGEFSDVVVENLYAASTITALTKRAEEAERLLTTAGTAEIASRNPNVMSYVAEWEARATAAERRLAEAERVIAPFANYGTWTIVWSNDDIVSCEFAVGDLRAARKWQEEGR